jgi:hypothetical protein
VDVARAGQQSETDDEGLRRLFLQRARINKLMKDAGFSRHTLTRVGKLYCVVAYTDTAGYLFFSMRFETGCTRL